MTNGEKGDTGDAWYVWIKYAGSEPTQDSDMGDTPDNWMGIYSGTSSTAPTHYTDYDWFQIKGEKGDTGAAATVASQSVTYQEAQSGTIAPSGSWSTTVPSVSQGNYLWTRTIIQFNSGSPITLYSVARMGVDGTGSVVSVNNQSPDGTGNVTVTASNIGTTDATSVQDDLTRLKTSLNGKAAKVDLTDINQTSPTCTVQNGIPKGTFFYLDGNLVKAISDIANGASFNSGVNYRSISDGLANELANHDWHYLTTTSTHYSMPNTQYQTNGYIIRSGMCFLTINLSVVNPSSSSEAICNVPVPFGVNTLIIPTGPDFETGATPARLLIQGGVLYIRGGTANTNCGASIAYPCDT